MLLGRWITVSNTGDDDLTVSNVSLAGSDVADFGERNSAFSLSPGATQRVDVSFIPTSAGPKTATLVIQSDDPTEPTVTISLLGTGAATSSNRVPVAAADHYVVTKDETLTVTAPGRLANDLDPDGDSITVAHASNPANGTLESNAANGSFTYSPDSGFTGTDTFSYRIRDANGSDSSFVPVTIEVVADPNRAPTAVADSYVVVQDETLSVSAPGLLANDADADSDTITATGSGAPTHGTMNLVTDGSFTYTPDSGFSGTDSFQYRIEDANGEDSAYATVTIEVLSDPNRAPTAISDQYSVATGETLTVSAPGLLRNDYDLDSDSISAVSYGRPNHGTLSLTTDGSFTYTSDPGYSGVDTFSYRIEDEHGEKSWYGTVSIDVTAPNRVPTAVSDHYTTLRGQNLSVDAPGVLANDYDPDSDSITTTGFSSPTNGSLSLTVDGSLTYVPDPGFTGTETLSYRIEDEHGTDSSFAALTIEVVDPSTTAPVATADSYTVDAGETLSVAATGLLANDRDPNDDSVSATGSTTPTHGTLNLVTDGSFTYTPNPGFSGTDSFQYRIRDANGEESAFTTVTIEVLPDPNRPPTAISDHYTVSAGETLTVDSPGVLDNDYDVDSDTVTTANFGRPNHGTVSLSVDGSLAYTPDSGFSGTDRFSYRIEDEHGVDSSFARISIEVIEPNREPTVVDDYYSIYAGETLSVDAPGLLSNDDDPDGDSISTVSSSRPAHGSRSLTTTGSFTYTPDPGYSGTDSFSYRIEDEHGENSWFGTVTIEVLPDPNRAPTASPDSYIMLQGESLTVNSPGLLANDYDADSDSVTTTNFGRPNHGTVSLSSTGSLTYVPDPSFTGTDTFVYRIEDEHGEDSLFVPVMITVVDTSVSGGPAVAVAQDSVDFGPTAAGATTTETVTVANIGDQNLTVSGATISGPNASAFAVTGGNESTVLGFGATRTLTVEYAPTAAGTDNATLTVLSDDPNEPAVAVALSGTASDDTAPTINTIVATGSSRDGSTVYTNETVDVAVHATDQFGTVGEVRISLDSQQSSYRVSKPATYDEILGNWTVSFTASDLVDDDWYDVIVTTADGEGNSATQTATDRVVVDRLPPQLAATVTRINSTAANVTVTSQSVLRTDSVAVDVEHPDGTVVPVQLKSDGSDWNGTFGLPVDGQYNLTATAVDLAGNRGTDRVTTSLSTESTDGNNTITTQIQPSGLFVRFTTNQSVNDTFVTMTESQVAVAPLVRGESGVTFLDAVLGNSLSSNLSYAQIGLPVDQSLLAAGTDVDDVTIRYFNESSNRWEDVSTTVENVTVNGSTDQYWVATVTHFSTYGAVVADTTPPTVTSTTPTDGHQLPAGTSSTTLRVEYDDTQTGINTGRTVVSFDDSLVTTDDATTVTSRYVEFEATGLTDGSSHELAVTIEDQAGNAHTETLSFTLKTATVPAPQPSGGGTSSSRQRSDVTPENPLRPQGYADIGADGRATVTLTDARVVDRIEVTIPGATGRTTVTELTDLPDGVSQPDGTNIALFDITAPNPASGTATVRISLNQSTVVSTGTRTADLRIQHYSGGVWETLGTTVVSTDGEIVLEAPVSSFSPFAVTAVDPQPEPTDDTTEPAPTPPESIPSAIDDETPGFGLLGAILGLLCAGLIGRRIDSRTQ
jgi:PGF-pre-PGF domain-containing protein/PGF-CTERM protein